MFWKHQTSIDILSLIPASAFQAEAVLSHTEPSLLQQPQQQQPNSTLAKQTPPADGERFSEADIRERIEFCREANQWAPLVHIVGQLFSDVGTLLRSFAIPSAVAKGSNPQFPPSPLVFSDSFHF